MPSSTPSHLRTIVLLSVALLFGHNIIAQPGGGQRPDLKGRLYGKILDDNTGRGIGYATVQLLKGKPEDQQNLEELDLVTGQLTAENGDFSLENIPLGQVYTLRINYMGYDIEDQEISFSKGQTEKDLGNIRIVHDAQLLKEVTITEEASGFTLAMDKKIYRVDQDGVAAGGTGEDALRNVPSLNVDLDGNVTLRNASPQIFVDGRPTALTIDQIPADAIDNVEVITNPSAKYDASGGNGGIVNIVLKKNRKIGYNGDIRGGIDMRGKLNLGANINAREGKFNAFSGIFYRGRKSLTWGGTDRENYIGDPRTNIYQDNEGVRDGYFGSFRAGVDWLMDNRNTLTVSGAMRGGDFGITDDIDIQTDTLVNGEINTGLSERTTENDRFWRNVSGQMLFKHLFPRPDKEWTADLTYNRSRSGNDALFQTDYFGVLPTGRQRQESELVNALWVAQTDVVDPLSEAIKVEYGARAAVRDFTSTNANFQQDPNTGDFAQVVNFADNYQFIDQVYAAYLSGTHSFKRWGYQAGLRLESSYYRGDLPDADTSFSNSYPLSLFPSVFFTYKLNEEDNLQLSYTRRINRPNFFQLIPFPDYSDSLQLRIGNPNLVPEFTNSVELSYQNIFNAEHNLLISVYYQLNTDLITNYQFTAFDEQLGREVVVSSFANANESTAYGVELTVKNTFWENIELVSNLNMYNATVDGTNIEDGLLNEQFSWFIKENLNIKLPKGFRVQVSGDYQSRKAFALGGRDRTGGWWGGPTSTAQGFVLPIWRVDLSVRKDLWDRAANINLSIQDIFRSRIRGTNTRTDAFAQESWSRRDPQFVRLNFSWRFGKFDQSLFKRKHNADSGEGGGF